LKDPIGRLGRWVVRLRQFNFDIVHRSGKDHSGSDALSRSPVDEPEESDLVDLVSVSGVEIRKQLNPNPVESVALSSQALALISVNSVTNDSWYSDLMEKILSDLAKFNDFKLVGEQVSKEVYIRKEKRWVRAIPEELREAVLRDCHDSPVGGHLGISKTLNRVRELYFWPKSNRFATDLMGPYTRTTSGFEYVIVTACLFSKYEWVRPLRNAV